METAIKALLRSAALACLGFLPSTIYADITLNVDAGILRNANGSATAPNGTLMILAVDTQNNGFQGPTQSQFVVNPDDVELYRWSLDSTGFQPGYTQPVPLTLTTAQIAAIPNLTSGDPLRLYWYPTLTTAASAPGAETPYGTYSNPSSVNGSIAWAFPSDPGTYTLNLLTTEASGSSPIPNSAGYADQLVVPEPATYALFAGIGCLAFGAYARRFRKS